MAGVLWSLLGIVAGTALAIQAPVNAALGRGLGLPVAAAAISFFTGAVVLTAVTVFFTKAGDISLDWRAPAPWLFVAGGCMGAFFVTSATLLAPRIGAMALTGFLISGQLVASMALDRIGLFGLAVREISLGRLAGALLLVAGAVLIRIA